VSRASRNGETKQVAGKYRHKGRNTQRAGNNSAAVGGDVSIRKIYVATTRAELIESIRSKAQTLPDGPI
jgi:hypothetical protein